MTTPGASNVEALDTLAAVARLLSRAADTAWAQADAQPLSVFAGLALGAQLASSQVLHLIPEDFDLDGPGPVETDFRFAARGRGTDSRASDRDVPCWHVTAARRERRPDRGDRAVTPADDRRTVDQLIRDRDLAARRILQSPEEVAAPAMLRSRAEVVECAAELWHALPGTPGPVEPKSVGLGDHGDAAMSRLGVMAAAWHRGLIRGNWPGAAGPGDGRLLGIAENLSLAEARLCGREPPRPQPTEALVDSGVAKARLVHTLYVGAHGIAVALRLHELDLLAAVSGKHRLPFGESFEQARQAQHRIAAFEQLAGSCVARTYPDGSRALLREPIGDGRLAQALARWDVQTHRTLATSTSTADLMVISQTERAIGAWSNLILRAAATTGAVDGDQQRERLSPAMARVEAAWAGMADLWRDLTHRTQRCVAAELHYSASEVRDALQEIVHNGMTVAAPEVMATRTDLRAAAQTMQQSLSTSVNLACLIRDTVASAAVVGDGRGISAIVARSPEAQGVSVEEDMAAAWGVSPWATATNALIPVPPPVQGALVVVADRVLDATSAAMNAGAFLDRTPPARIVDHSPAMGWERGGPMPHLDFGLSGPGFDR